MMRYIVRRVLGGVATLNALSVLVFIVLVAIPGTIVGSTLGAEGASDSDIAQQLEATYGLDRNVFVQYFDWLWSVIRGDLGESWRSARPVRDVILERLPLTIEITIGAIFVAIIIGVPLGAIAAKRQRTFVDHGARIAALLGAAIPVYLTATLVLLVGSENWGWVPPTGYVAFWSDPIENLATVITPILILGFSSAASISRMTRGAMIDVLSQDFVRAAEAKGLRPMRITIRHGLHNASIPVLTVLGVEAGVLLGGTVLTESVLSLPGVGRLVVDAITQRDYPVVQGTVLMIAGMFIAINIVTDLLYGLLDPRIRLEGDN